MKKISDIEKELDSFVVDFVRDACTSKVFSGTELVPISENSFRSIPKYDYVLNQAKFNTILLDLYKEQQLELSKTTKKPKEKMKGKKITKKTAFEIIFRGLFDYREGEKDSQGRPIVMRSFMVNIDTVDRVISKKAVAHNFENFISKMNKYRYFTPNMFISHRFFSKEFLSLLGVIILDFDIDKIGLVMSYDEISELIRDVLNVEPALVWDTKTTGNKQAAILIQNMAGTMKSVHLYEQIAKEMIYKLNQKINGVCDEACFAANHIFSMPQNNAHKGKFVYEYNREVHNINEFRWLLNERDERRARENANGKVKDFTIEAVRRHPAVVALRDGQVSFRNHACFTLALVERFFGKSEEEVENFILGTWIHLIDNEDKSFTEREAQHAIASAFSGRYKCFKSTYVEMVTGIECDLSGYFRNYYKYQATGAYITDTETRFKEFLRKNNNLFEGTVNDLTEKLGVKRRTLINTIDDLINKNKLIKTAQRGKGGKTTFELLEETNRTVFEKKKTITEELSILEEMEAVFQTRAVL
jgi:DNA-binding MarR family transcriptional regulator